MKIYCDFSDIYIAEGKNDRRIDLSDISGTNGYCTDEAGAEIKERIEKYDSASVYITDNGNHHYMSYIRLEAIREKFNLVVFDNHTDMQEAALVPVLSCGNWILEVLKNKEIPVNKIYLIGPPAEAFENVDNKYKKKIGLIAKSETDKWENAEDIKRNAMLQELTAFDLPVFISVDKDVLSTDELRVNWDQGSMSADTLVKAIEYIAKDCRITGVDLCGEPDKNQDGFPSDFEKSRRIDERICEILN